jgi:hypothetical protein
VVAGSVLDLDGAACGTIAGGLPGTITLDIAQPLGPSGLTGIQTYDGADRAAAQTFVGTLFGVESAWDSAAETRQCKRDASPDRPFMLFKMAPHHPAVPDNEDAMQQYADLCAAHGMRPIGCGSGSYCDSMEPYNGMGMPNSWSCNIDFRLRPKTGWTSVAFIESRATGMYGVDALGSGTGAPDDGFAPVCGREH